MATANLTTCFFPNFTFIFLTSLIPIWIWWEFIYLEDDHPEPRYMLLLAIILGVVAAILSYFAQAKIYYLLGYEFNYVYYFLSAFVEEFFKFILVFLFILPTRYFDELVDVMIYMGFTALGFAFIETYLNICSVLINPPEGISPFFASIAVSILRFLGANFLHMLASVLVGFGYAVSLKTRRILPFVYSFLMASFLHFLYNIFIIREDVKLLIFPILWAIYFITLIEFKIIKIKNGGVGTYTSN
ncbi:MAG: PrsW family intramembrane metalloprotease [Minisyncoccia bacterium]